MPLLSGRTARVLFIVIWVFLVAYQGLYLLSLGNGLDYPSNPHAEADVLRASEGYLKQGMDAHHLLPRILYGHRFPHDGGVKLLLDSQDRVFEKNRLDFPPEMGDRNQWIYTHYPPGADLLIGGLAKVIGLDPIWRLRLFPVAFGLLSLAILFRTITRICGIERGALFAVAVATLPMISAWMPTISLEGCTMGLALIQASVVIRALWEKPKVGWAPLLGLFLIGFVQGALTYDYLFVVTFLALPWWLLRRAEGANVSARSLFWMVALPGAGFVLAHVVHVLIIADELHGLRPALAELQRIGAERGGLESKFGWFKYAAKAIYYYIRSLFKPTLTGYAPWFMLALVVSGLVALFADVELKLRSRRGRGDWRLALRWPGAGSVLPALAAMVGVCGLWLFIMPQHTAGNFFLTVMHFVCCYVFMAFIIVRSLCVRAAA